MDSALFSIFKRGADSNSYTTIRHNFDLRGRWWFNCLVGGVHVSCRGRSEHSPSPSLMQAPNFFHDSLRSFARALIFFDLFTTCISISRHEGQQPSENPSTSIRVLPTLNFFTIFIRVFPSGPYSYSVTVFTPRLSGPCTPRRSDRVGTTRGTGGGRCGGIKPPRCWVGESGPCFHHRHRHHPTSVRMPPFGLSRIRTTRAVPRESLVLRMSRAVGACKIRRCF